MLTITIDNSYSQVTGLKAQELKSLQKLLSYEVNPGTSYYTGGFARRKSLVDKKGFFPTGLLLRVKAFLGPSAAIVDVRVQPSPTPGMFKMRLET